MNNWAMCVGGLLFLAYVFAFVGSASCLHIRESNPPMFWLVVFMPLIGVLWLMVWVLCPVLFHDLEKKR